jgi:hypothetical protein
MNKSRFNSMPPRMKQRPVDHRGFPVPWFVTNKTVAGLWDFVHVDPVEVTFWTKGREATPAEARALFDARADKLGQMAAEEGFNAIFAFQKMKDRAEKYLPVGA